ncbi:MAG: hypothetical protein AB8H79_22420 [Myxococcota bacterium]
MLTGWASVAVWVAPACIIGLAIVAGALWTLRNQRNCPSCKTPMTVLGAPAPIEESRPPSYEVLVCPTCTNAATLVHGHKSRFAYCPSCLNRALGTPCIRQADGSVRVEEHCHVCGFRAERVVESAAEVDEPAPRLGVVIPFPQRPPHATPDEETAERTT